MSDTGTSPTGQEPVVVVRSEEQLSTTTIRTATERVRIRKVIVTEERTVTVQLRREELVIEREPLDEAVMSSEKALGPIAVVLHAERPVISTQVVPVERVSVVVDRIVQMTTVSDSVRKERIDVQKHANTGALDDTSG